MAKKKTMKKTKRSVTKKKQTKSGIKARAAIKKSMPQSKEEITRDTTLEEIMNIPGAQAILFENHVPCMNCPMGAYEMPMLKLGMVCDMYGLEYDKIVKELKRLKEIGFEKWQEEKKKEDKANQDKAKT